MKFSMQHHPDHVKSDFLRWMLICIGWIAIAGGVVGIFLPLVPTVPFLLLAVICFSKSSVRFHSWLIEHNHLGPLVRDYLAGGGMPLRAKQMAIGMVWISFPASAFLIVHAMWIKVLLLVIAAGVTLYLLYLPTSRPADKDRKDDTIRDDAASR